MSENDELEAEARAWFSPLREGLARDPHPELAEKSLGRVKDAIGAGDLVEFGTTVLVVQFLAPVLDILAFALGLEDQEDDHD